MGLSKCGLAREFNLASGPVFFFPPKMLLTLFKAQFITLRYICFHRNSLEGNNSVSILLPLKRN